MAHHRPAHRKDRTAKWTEEVEMSRVRRSSCRAPKEAFVAIRRVGVVPGVKTEDQRFSKKVAIFAFFYVGFRAASGVLLVVCFACCWYFGIWRLFGGFLGCWSVI